MHMASDEGTRIELNLPRYERQTSSRDNNDEHKEESFRRPLRITQVRTAPLHQNSKGNTPAPSQKFYPDPPGAPGSPKPPRGPRKPEKVHFWTPPGPPKSARKPWYYLTVPPPRAQTPWGGGCGTLTPFFTFRQITRTTPPLPASYGLRRGSRPIPKSQTLNLGGGGDLMGPPPPPHPHPGKPPFSTPPGPPKSAPKVHFSTPKPHKPHPGGGGAGLFSIGATHPPDPWDFSWTWGSRGATLARINHILPRRTPGAAPPTKSQSVTPRPY